MGEAWLGTGTDPQDLGPLTAAGGLATWRATLGAPAADPAAPDAAASALPSAYQQYRSLLTNPVAIDAPAPAAADPIADPVPAAPTPEPSPYERYQSLVGPAPGAAPPTALDPAADDPGRPLGSGGFFGGAAELGRSVARGIYNLPDLPGEAAEGFGRPLGLVAPASADDLAARAAQREADARALPDWMKESARSRAEEHPLGSLAQAGESLVQSTGPMAAGAAAGAAIGSLLPGPGTLAGATLGAVAGSVLGIFGAAGRQAEASYETIKTAQLAAGVPEPQAEHAAITGGLANGAIEGGGEALGTYLFLRMGSLIPPSIKSAAANAVLARVGLADTGGTLIQSAASNQGALWGAAKDLALKVLPAELGTEMAQGALQQGVEHAYGAGPAPTWGDAAQVVVPTLVMVGFTAGGTHAFGAYRRSAVNHALANPEDDTNPFARRVAAAAAVEDAVRREDPELAAVWHRYAVAALGDNTPLVVDHDAWYQEQARAAATPGAPDGSEPALEAGAALGRGDRPAVAPLGGNPREPGALGGDPAARQAGSQAGAARPLDAQTAAAAALGRGGATPAGGGAAGAVAPALADVAWPTDPVEVDPGTGADGSLTREFRASPDGQWLWERAVDADGTLAADRVVPTATRRQELTDRADALQQQITAWSARQPETPWPAQWQQDLTALRAAQARYAALAPARADGPPASGPNPAPTAAAATGGSERFLSLRPEDVGVDAKRFQFRSAADAVGDTGRLAGVQTWDPDAAGAVNVWQDEAGKNWVVDGHHRVNLAKQLAAQGQDVRLDAQVWRAADGVTAEQARQRAAVKNVQEGNADALDIARLWREMTPLERDDVMPRLPRFGSTAIRDGEALAQLGPKAWDLVRAGVVPPPHAAEVSRVLAEDEQQRAVLGYLQKHPTANAQQARLVAEQMRDASFERAAAGAQGDLFGDQQMEESLFAERARVIDAAVRSLTKDRAVFNLLSREAGRIEGAGNRLERGANQARVQEADQVGTILRAEANVAGPISTAVRTAASAVRAGQQPGTAARGVVEAVRQALSERGWLRTPPATVAPEGTVTPQTPETPPETADVSRETTPPAAPEFSLASYTEADLAELAAQQQAQEEDAPGPAADAQGDLFGVAAQTAAENVGAYDPSNPDIRFSIAQESPHLIAVTATTSGRLNPVTGKPEFDLFDAAGNRLGKIHIASTAQEALAIWNRRATAASPGGAQGSTLVVQAAPAAPPERAQRSYWTMVRGPIGQGEQPDDYYYHVTSYANARRIIREGLAPDQAATMADGWYRTYSRGKVFVTERNGVPFWRGRIEDHLAHEFDRPPAVAVVRIPKHQAPPLERDEVGSRDARADAWFGTSRFSIGPHGRAPDGVTGLPVADVQTVVDAALSRLLGPARGAVSVRVVATQAEAFGMGSLDRLGRVRGAFDPATDAVVLVAEHLATAADVRTVLRHELVGHYGFRLLSDAQRGTFADLVEDAAKRIRSVGRLLAQERAKDPGLSRERVAEEVFARVAEQERGFIGAAWDQVLLWLRQQWRALGLIEGRPGLTELRVLAADVARALRAGARPVGALEGAGVRYAGQETDARLAGLLAQYAAVKGAPSAAQLAEAVRQYREVEARYADVLRAHDAEGKALPAPNGQPSKLNREQWILVRTDNFKRWFGDFEAVARQRQRRALIERALTDTAWQQRTPIAAGYDADPSGKLSDTFGFPIATTYLAPDDIRKTNKRHGVGNERRADQVGLAVDDYLKALEVLRDPETFKRTTSNNGKPSAEFGRRFSDGTYVVAEVEIAEAGGVSIKSAWKKVPGRNHEGATPFPIRTSANTAGVTLSISSDSLLVNPDAVSKLVDANGEPLVVYHGTSADFNRFAKRKTGTGTLARDANGAFFFTTSPAVAEDFAGYLYTTPDGQRVERTYQQGANLMPVFLRAAQPDVWDMGGGSYTESWMADALKSAKRDRKDAVVFRQLRDGSVSTVGPWQPSNVIAVFAPTAIKSAIGNAGTFGPGNPDIRFAFAGERAATADTHALSRAQQGLAQGLTAEEVRRQTGWFQGADGKWRFEIDDSGALLRTKIDGAFKSTAQGMEAWAPLGAVLTHPSLFAAYPALRQVQTDIIINPDGKPKGQYGDTAITVDARSVEEALSILLHEVQHALQHREGFATGGTPETFRYSDEDITRLATQMRALQQRYHEARDTGVDLYGISDSLESIKNDADRAKQEWSEYRRLSKETRGNPLDAYHRLSGEVEARNVQARQALGRADRKNTPPGATHDVPDADVIVVFNGREMASAPRPANADEPSRNPEQTAYEKKAKGASGGTPAAPPLDVLREDDYRPAVVTWAKAQFKDQRAPDGSLAWENFVRWFGLDFGHFRRSRSSCQPRPAIAGRGSARRTLGGPRNQPVRPAGGPGAAA
uniref:LPD23 domain-containing protein n=1 Tax=uncultured Lamprocystis sp. TaxID=543132 RepID=UPI00345AB099